MSGEEKCEVVELEQPPPPFPYLHRAELELNIDSIIQNTNSSAERYEVSRIKDDVPFTNGIMQDIRECWNPLNLTNECFFLYLLNVWYQHP